ncbi:MEMO1 family protein [Geothrix rubra]|uniref:MEMO1 family protein GETHPA_18880 n=1 Tax=Geothrix rubra TaxID=2927977 RepID=A0ABQ5Q8C9_9BACT|nr:AmmeMemoRadiSam system protein B [Geothrix rubra]GLH70355.1 MEMO1 family protein [Geothrix rubra]
MLTLRPAVVAGMFYPEDPERLREEVDRLLDAVRVPLDEPTPKALIVPHAGYAYSGPVAASGYARLLREGPNLTRVVLLGPSHHAAFPGLALPEAEAFETPLGPQSIDAGATARIPWVRHSEAIHRPEHSLEVQVPFLQRVAPQAELVPLAVGQATPFQVAEVLEALWGGTETVIIVSSDLSHYLPYRLGRAVDEETSRMILRLDTTLDSERACGAAPVAGLLEVARRKQLHPALLDLRSSGDTAGGQEEVVGYGAFAFFETGAGHP